MYKENDKSATNKLHIGAKLSFKGFIKACIDFNLEKTKVETNLGATRASGDYSQLAASGDYSKLAASGYGSVVMAAGYNSIARAKKGSWITLAEWVNTGNKDEGGNYIRFPKYVKTEYVDGEKIKEDVFYKLIDGEFKEVTETEE